MSSRESSPAPPQRLTRLVGPDELRMIGHLLLALCGLFVVVAAVGYLLRPQLSALGTAFVDRFGLLGMALGTFLADGFQFPVAPQFYMLASMVRGGSAVPPLLCITAASVVGGCAGALVARRASSLPFVRRRLDKSRPLIDRMLQRYGAWTFVILSIAPMPFSLVCYLIGMYRMPKRYLALFLGLRGPRLALMYVIIRAAWGASG